MKPSRVVLLILALGLANVSAQAQQCLHDETETAPEKGRRTLALSAARFINTAQMHHRRLNGEYATWNQLPSSSAAEEVRGWLKPETIKALNLSGKSEIVPGFELRLTTNGEAYSLLLRDNTDPCKFSLFSDQQGVIYYGQPIDKPPSAALLEAK